MLLAPNNNLMVSVLTSQRKHFLHFTGDGRAKPAETHELAIADAESIARIANDEADSNDKHNGEKHKK